MNAAHALDDALLRMAEHGQSPPCFWHAALTSDEPAERRAAAPICMRCPIADLCGAAADERDERFGVWGDGLGRPGRDRTPRPHKARGRLEVEDRQPGDPRVELVLPPRVRRSGYGRKEPA